jgi:hypothetical protein
LSRSERNLRRAQSWAVELQLWRQAVELAQMAGVLYGAQERGPALWRMFAPMQGRFDDGQGMPKPGFEFHWNVLMQVQLGYAQQHSQWDLAEQLGERILRWHRQEAEIAENTPAEQWPVARGDAYRGLPGVLKAHSYTYRLQGDGRCKPLLMEAIQKARQRKERIVEAEARAELAQALIVIDSIRDLDLARDQIQRSLALCTDLEKDEQANLWLSLANADQIDALAQVKEGKSGEDAIALFRRSVSECEQAWKLASPASHGTRLRILTTQALSLYNVSPSNAPEALRLLLEARRISVETGDRGGSVQALLYLTALYHDIGDIGAARRHYQEYRNAGGRHEIDELSGGQEKNGWQTAESPIT